MVLILLLLFLISIPFSVQAQQSGDTPKAGEGISAFLKRNNRSGQAYYKEFLELNKKRLRGKEELQLGVRYVLPPLKSEKKTASKEGPAGTAAAPEDSLSGAAASSEIALRGEGGEESKGLEPSVSPAAGDRKGVVREPLFRKEFTNVRVKGNSLRGACFYVVSGHGGPDPGAIGKVGSVELHEDEYAYDVALRLARNLMEEGAEVRIIIQDAKDGIRNDRYLANSKRETCMGDAIPLNQVARLRQRCEWVNKLYRSDRKKYKYCRAIFLHVDSRSKGMQTDVFFYHASKSVLGKKLAVTMKDTFESKYGKHQPNRGFSGTVSGRNLYVLLNASPVSVFVELGNIQNAFDQRRFVISSNRQALAKWMTEGFIADFRRAK